MSKNCARCTKVVYPIEELKCLDKVWHKTCFKCTECNMALNMKTYKGFNKNPYCEAHIPKAKATTIAETPELKRIAENTKIQSNVQYHAEFEKSKGKLTQIADDPETLRIKQNTKNISNVAYHGEIQKKAAMERQRELTEIIDNRENESEYFSETLAAESLPHYQPTLDKKVSPTNSPYSSVDATSNYTNNNSKYDQQYSPPQNNNENNNMINNNPKYQQTHNYNPNVLHGTSVPAGMSNQQMQQQLQQKYYDQYEMRPNGNNNEMSQSTYNNNLTQKTYGHQIQMTSSYNQHMNYNNQHNALNVGKISDYDPMTEGPRNIPQTARTNQTLIYSSDRAAMNAHQQQQRRIGSVNDIDPLNGFYGSIAQDPYMQQHQIYQHQQQQQQRQKSASKVKVYRALYDYEAQDSDEVSFAEGDLIFEVNSIDAGWITGRVERTGKIGMLPANYIEQDC